jgi:hypothetical protein
MSTSWSSWIAATGSAVSPAPCVTIAGGQRASAGDLIVCTRNDHSVEAGEPGRPLANGDLLRIDAVTPRGPIVRRALDCDPASGRRRWTERLPFRHRFCFYSSVRAVPAKRGGPVRAGTAAP